MARPRLPPERVPTPGPWVVVEAGRSPGFVVQAGSVRGHLRGVRGRPDSVRGQSDPVAIASAIDRRADAVLLAAAPDLAAIVLRLVARPQVSDALDPQHRETIAAAWTLLAWVAPHLEL